MTAVRCPDAVLAQDMMKLIEEVKSDGDSIGGVVTCVIRNVPCGRVFSSISRVLRVWFLLCFFLRMG